jgi:hypothetical protein
MCSISTSRGLSVCVAVLTAAGAPRSAHAGEVASTVRAHAVRRSGAIVVDGRLDEVAWTDVPRNSGFLQRFPVDAAAPSLETRFAIVYDNDAIYVGVWADDPRPDLIRALLIRRDLDSPADTIMVAFDSYHDRRTAYAFQLNAAGVQRDMLLFDDSRQDDSWDAVWTGNVAVTAAGWTAEYRIPLNQLRFAGVDPQEWGLQVLRSIGRTGEQDAWSPWPRSTPQVVSKFGVVDGIAGLGGRPRLEFLPYVTAGLDHAPVDAGDPLNQPNRWRRSVGLDLRYGLGPAFTVSATINPDFGQVEADPSKINLSANELFLAEKRPFFVEGADLFKLPLGNGDNTIEGFYSRRIGAAPSLPNATYDFINAPQATAIYGAAKLSGKTAGSWSVGVLDAVTGPEATEIATTGDPNSGPARQRLAVAPLTNYAIARVKRDLGEGRTAIGASATAVNRNLDSPELASAFRDQAYTGGLQLQHRWANNAWTAELNAIDSWVHGSEQAIASTQKSPVHYFQRPDARDVHLDPNRTDLSGLAAKWLIGRLGDTNRWRYGFGGGLRTAGLELNDAGFQRSSDRAIPYFMVQYREDAPGDHLLNWQVSSDVYWIQTLEPLLLDYALETTATTQFANYWSLSSYAILDHGKWDLSALRGGRALRVDSSVSGNVSLTTDTRKSLWFNLMASAGHNWSSGVRDFGVNLGATVQARSNLDLFVGPSIYVRNDPMQYVDQVADDLATAPPHFVFGRIHETIAAMTLRVNWTFSPRLGLQAYIQPYIASGRYDELKDVDRPGAARYADRFDPLGGDLQLIDGRYHVMRGGSGFRFDRPDFNFRQLRSTMVLRWEYRPGSTVFAIWSRGQTSNALDDGQFRLGRDVSDLLSARSNDTLLIKASYWIGT